eukprot:CAMPEP_0178433152 /NCGR_PEP_ID=MMETSP0689_2-20121128/32756_1 /TAXON_ID=160604 /ORGANISM="Amphidinium massartii, Strain CS-259" /LENGTH=755 /DNA_ID=CAMNT_0020055167 /DNA_START=98 /DNA_END=2365 /DNA_ORIENTATION=-
MGNKNSTAAPSSSQASMKIMWTYTDEAPMLATFSLLPIVNQFTKQCNVEVETKDISVAGRIIANFPENLTEEQKIPDELAALGALTLLPEANIIKLPNISASIPQLKEAIKELQSQGYEVPDYPESPATPEEKDVQARYKKIIGSAVNPVLREGNSDRRAAASIKEHARNHPPKPALGPWTSSSKTHVSSMTEGDFFGSESTAVVAAPCKVKIELVAADGTSTVLKEGLSLTAGEVIDASKMSCKALETFFETQLQDCLDKDVLCSLHMKATMMKVSDPIMFGHMVKVYFKDVFAAHADTFAELGVNANNGLGDVLTKIAKLPEEKRKKIEADIAATYEKRPKLAMVDSDNGITNLHVPSDVIIDASMPNVVRDSGCMWGPDGKLKEVKCIIPDRCYSGVYQKMIDFCKENGAFDRKTMGSVPNVGLMAIKAEEYGSHDKTFEIQKDGAMRVVDESGKVLLETPVETGDIWRMCQCKDIAIKDWVKLAVTRARSSGATAVFWLDEKRPHEKALIEKAKEYLKGHDTAGLDIQFMAPADACWFSCERMKKGLDTISVTGNVLRDYNTDLFPILEVGTSAKMLSIVPLLAGGGLYETGAGGSAPKHVEQFVKENHLRWDSVGEFLALQVSLEELAEKSSNSKGKVLAAALDKANGRFLEANKNPGRKVKEIDNRGSHFYLAMFWADALAEQAEDVELKEKFSSLSKALHDNEEKITTDLMECQGKSVEIGGYYHPDAKLLEAAMRPSETLNSLLAAL